MKLLVNTFAICLILILVSCGLKSSNKNSFDKHERELVEEEIASFKQNLPYEIAGKGFVMTNVEIANELVIYTYKVSKENWDVMFLSHEVSSSDRNIARVISNIDKETINKLIRSGLGVKYVYVSQETNRTLLEIEVQSNKLKEVSDKLGKGEIEPYTLLELSKIELAKMEIPFQVGEGLWLTDAYIKGNNIYYIATFEYEIDKSNISDEDIAEVKESCIAYLREEPLISSRKEEFIKENIHFVYIYKDSRGKECMTVSIAPDEIF